MGNIFNSYFGAANGFSGFRSYFNEIFFAKDFTRIYVLKGGPGTGKSNLMKTVASYFENEGFLTDRIYCSSDPNSLDGVIVYNGNKKIAVIDGTAPHETDAKIPGAADEIINLGNMWDRSQLIEKRKLIEDLNEKKRIAYEKAYKYLHYAGEFFKDTYSIINNNFNSIDALHTIKKYFEFTDINQSRTIVKRLNASFGKYGYKSLITDSTSFSELISVTGIFGSEYVFMNSLKSKLYENNYDLFIFPSPYSDELIEAIYITHINVFIGLNIDCEKEIDTKEFLNQKVLDSYNDLLSNLYKEYNELLIYSQKEFEKASECHFSLEEIYTPSMNFEILNKTTESLIKDILFLL